MTLPILYSFRRCPYAMRARLSLYAMGISCALREVHLKNKPEEMLDISPKATVPVLQLQEGTVIDESLDVMLWAVSQSTDTPNLPKITMPTSEMLALISKIDGPFKHNLDRYKYSNRYEGAVSETFREKNLEFLQELENRLSVHAYLFEDHLTFADLAIAPFIRQFANTDRTWFEAAPYPKLSAWLGQFCDSKHFNDIMIKYTPWKPTDLPLIFPQH